MVKEHNFRSYQFHLAYNFVRPISHYIKGIYMLVLAKNLSPYKKENGRGET